MHKDMKTRKLHARMKENLQKGFLYLRSCLSVLILFVRKDLNSSDSFCYICGSFTIPRHRTNISTFVNFHIMNDAECAVVVAALLLEGAWQQDAREAFQKKAAHVDQRMAGEEVRILPHATSERASGEESSEFPELSADV
ncbi:uncharacterized protein [Dendrobates tinctorius]|uniref:uncharacterized protein isoform X3 n=1 Tax=Dendrobates tinctorius TaxID=92724 RepID=UPI003CC92D99